MIKMGLYRADRRFISRLLNIFLYEKKKKTTRDYAVLSLDTKNVLDRIE